MSAPGGPTPWEVPASPGSPARAASWRRVQGAVPQVDSSPSLGGAQGNELTPHWPPRCSVTTCLWAGSGASPAGQARGGPEGQGSPPRGAPRPCLPPNLHSRPSSPACVACDLSTAGRVGRVTGRVCVVPRGRRLRPDRGAEAACLRWGQRPPWLSGWLWASPLPSLTLWAPGSRMSQPRVPGN